MRFNCLILTVFAGCILLLQTGCQEAVKQSAGEGLGTRQEAVELPQAGLAEPQVDEGLPDITFEKLVHDFGEIGPKTRNVCEFKFTNTGDGLLKIGKIRTTCGCAVPQLKKKEYGQGESGVVKVIYRSGSRPGSTKKRLFVPSNDKTNPKVTLTIRARILKKIGYEPTKLNLLLKNENAGCPAITLSSLDNQPFAIKEFKSTANCITADFDPSVEAAKFVIEPKVDIERLQKALNGRVNIKLTHPQCNAVSITYSTLPEFATRPLAIVLLDVEPLKTERREVWVLNNYNEDFEIESTSSRYNITKVLSQQKVGNRYKLELEITPPTTGGKTVRMFTDVLTVNIKGGKKVEIGCRGLYSKKHKK